MSGRVGPWERCARSSVSSGKGGLWGDTRAMRLVSAEGLSQRRPRLPKRGAIALASYRYTATRAAVAGTSWFHLLRVASCELRVACCVLRIACCVSRVTCHASRTSGGAARTRTGDRGFAVPCLTPWLRRHVGSFSCTGLQANKKTPSSEGVGWQGRFGIGDLRLEIGWISCGGPAPLEPDLAGCLDSRGASEPATRSVRANPHRHGRAQTPPARYTRTATSSRCQLAVQCGRSR